MIVRIRSAFTLMSSFQFPKNLPPDTRVCGMNRDRLPITPDPALEVTEFDIPARDRYQVRVRSYRSTDSKDTKLPLFIYMHGRGFVTGGLETDDASCRTWAKSIPFHILSIEYRLAPEHKFPTGFEDCWDVLKWASTSSNLTKLNIDPSKGFLLGGTSAGGNFTSGLAHHYMDEKPSPSITGLIYLAANVCHPDVRPAAYHNLILSVTEIDDAPGLTKTSIEYFWKLYEAPKDDKRYSPLLYESWPGVAKKAYLSVCGWDPRRDEMLLFEGILKGDGLGVRKDVYKGLPHGFWTTCPDLDVSRRWEGDVTEGIKWILK